MTIWIEISVFSGASELTKLARIYGTNTFLLRLGNGLKCRTKVPTTKTSSITNSL